MDNSGIEGTESYKLLIRKRKSKWNKLFAKFENIGDNSEEIEVTDLLNVTKDDDNAEDINENASANPDDSDESGSYITRDSDEDESQISHVFLEITDDEFAENMMFIKNSNEINDNNGEDSDGVSGNEEFSETRTNSYAEDLSDDDESSVEFEKKRPLLKSESDDNEMENERLKRRNTTIFKEVNLYINASESDFETDSD